METEINPYIRNNRLSILARPNSPKTTIIGWDPEKNALRVNVKAKPEDNEANIEIIRFFSKLLKKKVTIKSGLRNRNKILYVGDES